MHGLVMSHGFLGSGVTRCRVGGGAAFAGSRAAEHVGCLAVIDPRNCRGANGMVLQIAVRNSVGGPASTRHMGITLPAINAPQ